MRRQLKTILVTSVMLVSLAWTNQLKDKIVLHSEHIPTNQVPDRYRLDPTKTHKTLANFCQKTKKKFEKYGWKKFPCGNIKWKAELKTIQGNPIIYAEFGNGTEGTTLFLGGVHPDEITPIHLAFKLARYLNQNFSKLNLNKNKVIVAPLVNPDGFFLKRPIRTNIAGIDPNRNFPTSDWFSDAHKAWAKRGKRLRYFPGSYPQTSIETVFQQQLIARIKPDKIVSIHAPLGFLDYDGPGDQKPSQLSMEEKRAKQLVHHISKQTENYRIVDYSFYPGSLGNYAGQQNGIPTITLELKTTNPKNVSVYWERFQPGLVKSILYPFKTPLIER